MYLLFTFQRFLFCDVRCSRGFQIFDTCSLNVFEGTVCFLCVFLNCLCGFAMFVRFSYYYYILFSCFDPVKVSLDSIDFRFILFVSNLFCLFTCGMCFLFAPRYLFCAFPFLMRGCWWWSMLLNVFCWVVMVFELF